MPKTIRRNKERKCHLFTYRGALQSNLSVPTETEPEAEPAEVG